MKKYLFPLLTFCVVMLSLTITSAQQKPQFKVLAFYTTTVEMDHANFAKDALWFFKDAADRYNFTFDATTDWANMNDDVLSNYQVVVWLNNSPGGAQREAFQRFMEKGGAWLGCHVSGFNLPGANSWTWFNKFMGGAYFKSNNWPPLPAKVIVEDRTHPATKRLPATYISPSGEWYQWAPSPRLDPNIKVLASLAPENYPLGVKSFISGGDTPVIWTNTKYKMLYVNMGHSNKIFSNADQNNFWVDALIWLGGGVRKEPVK